MGPLYGKRGGGILSNNEGGDSLTKPQVHDTGGVKLFRGKRKEKVSGKGEGNVISLVSSLERGPEKLLKKVYCFNGRRPKHTTSKGGLKGEKREDVFTPLSQKRGNLINR